MCKYSKYVDSIHCAELDILWNQVEPASKRAGTSEGTF